MRRAEDVVFPDKRGNLKRAIERSFSSEEILDRRPSAVVPVGGPGWPLLSRGTHLRDQSKYSMSHWHVRFRNTTTTCCIGRADRMPRSRHWCVSHTLLGKTRMRMRRRGHHFGDPAASADRDGVWRRIGATPVRFIAR